MSNTGKKVLIVEDDPIFALDMEIIIEELKHLLIATVDNAADALKEIRKGAPDLILLDIKIKGDIDGVQLANQIKPLEIPIIFITSFDDQSTFNRAQLAAPVSYLVKPFDKLTLQSTIDFVLLQKAVNAVEELSTSNISELQSVEKAVFIKQGNKIFNVFLGDLLWIHSDGNYCELNTLDKKYVLKTSLVKIAALLPKAAFTRIHKSYIIQTESIQHIIISTNEVYIKGREQPLPLGRTYKEELLSKLSILS